jgi:hypothetical protein
MNFGYRRGLNAPLAEEIHNTYFTNNKISLLLPYPAPHIHTYHIVPLPTLDTTVDNYLLQKMFRVLSSFLSN